MSQKPIQIVLLCDAAIVPKAKYVLDTLLLAGGIRCVYVETAPSLGPWLLYGSSRERGGMTQGCGAIAHVPEAWAYLQGASPPTSASDAGGVAAVFGQRQPGFDAPCSIDFDLVANAFYLLSSWAERNQRGAGDTRHLFADSVYARLGLPQDLVDRYLEKLLACLRAAGWNGVDDESSRRYWPDGAAYAIVLSHDVDFVPYGITDMAKQAVKTFARHMLKERSPGDAARSTAGFFRAVANGRDPYGCVPEIIARERAMGLRSSFQVAVGHRHPADVNYYIEDDPIRDYLTAIPESGFDLCLHGSYRSTEDPAWYVEEVNRLGARLCRPLGSRQHFLSFDYDNLFSAQEAAGIQYDMSMGFPDWVGTRAGFSHPYFPYDVERDRAYDVLQISLVLMDVTLRGYMQLKGEAAWAVIKGTLDKLRHARGCASVVWHPIVFGGARDPGSEDLYWRMAEYVQGTSGLATDGRTINAFWRKRASDYASFAGLALAASRED